MRSATTSTIPNFKNERICKPTTNGWTPPGNLNLVRKGSFIPFIRILELLTLYFAFLMDGSL